MGTIRLTFTQVIAAALLGFSAAAASDPDALTTASPFARSSFFPPAITAADINEAVSNSLKDVSAQLEKFNLLYLGKLEAKIMAIATLMGHIDSNVKHLQERAHVWDTFQLHVSAWNEQIKSLDRKVDFISRGQERFEVFDTKMNQLMGTQEAQMQRVSIRLDEMDTRLGAVAKIMEESAAAPSISEPAAPLLGEFATRGVLSTLKGIERKVDKLIAQAKAEERSNLIAEKAAAKCQAPTTVLEALLQDVASKVDVIFDRLPEEGEAEVRSIDTRTWRRMASPLRRTWRALESVEKAVRSSEETNVQLKRGQDQLLKMMNHTLRHSVQSSDCCRKHREENHNSSIRATNTCIAAVSDSADMTLQSMRDLFSNASTEIEHLEDLILDHIAYNTTCPTDNNHLAADEDEDLMSPAMEIDYADMSTQSSMGTTVKTKRVQWLCSDVTGHSGVTSLLGEDVALGQGAVEANGAQNWLYCDQNTEGGGWTVVQRRGSYGETQENFTRTWEDYKKGFGDLRREFWAGNEFLHHATAGDRPVKLRIELRDFEGNFTFAEYSLFRVGSEKTNFRLTVAGFTGNASDSFSSHNGTPFSTIDRTHDKAPECCPCAKTYASGWWFTNCFEANLNGEYFFDPEDNSHFEGIIWEKWREDYSLAHTEMKIRPADFDST